MGSMVSVYLKDESKNKLDYISKTDDCSNSQTIRSAIDLYYIYREKNNQIIKCEVCGAEYSSAIGQCPTCAEMEALKLKDRNENMKKSLGSIDEQKENLTTSFPKKCPECNIWAVDKYGKCVNCGYSPHVTEDDVNGKN